MRVGDFPVEQTLEYRLQHAENIHRQIDSSCPEGMLFASATKVDVDTLDAVQRYSEKFYVAHTDPFSTPNPSLAAEPFHFSMHVAAILQDTEPTVKVPENAEWSISVKGDDTVDGRLLFDLYLSQNQHLDTLIKLYMDRLSGIDMMADHVIEPNEVRHARLLAGATFLLVDIINAQAYHDELVANDLLAMAEFEKQFSLGE